MMIQSREAHYQMLWEAKMALIAGGWMMEAIDPGGKTRKEVNAAIFAALADCAKDLVQQHWRQEQGDPPELGEEKT